MKYYVRIGQQDYQIDLEEKGSGLVARMGEDSYILDHEEVEEGSKYSVIIDGESFNVSLTPGSTNMDLIVGGHVYHAEVVDERERGAKALEKAKGTEGPQVLKSVMPGIVRKVFIEEGQEVASGDPLLILEAMKMENELCAEKGGVVAKVHIVEGQTVNSSDPLITIR